MQVSRDGFLLQNRDLLRSIVTDIRANDDADTIDDRVGSRVSIIPADAQAEEITIRVLVNAIVAVSKGADLDNILSLLAAASNGAAIGALGTGLTPTALKAVNDLGEASVFTLKRIMAETIAQGNKQIIAPVEGVDLGAQGKAKIQMSGTVNGWAVTTDTDIDEIANFSYHCLLLNNRSAASETENVGKQAQIPLVNSVQEISADVRSKEFSAFLDMGYNLKTDGAFTHDTVSLVQIADATIVLKYV